MAWNEPGGNGKDPWGHRNNEQGPPDLDELIKKMQDKLGGLFGGSGDGGGSSNQNNNGWNFKIILVLSIIGLMIWMLFGFYTIQPAYQGLVLRFGAYERTSEQGLNWHFPYPVERVIKLNVDERRVVQHQALMLTKDENIVDVSLAVQFKVENSEYYLFNVRDPEDTLKQATESALREVVGTSTMDDVLTTGRDLVAEQTRELTQDILGRYKTGLLVLSVNMQNAQPPEEVQGAFADVIKAREDEERLKNKADAYRNEVVQKAGGVSDRMTQEAEAYRAEVVERANGETRRFLSILKEYQAAPDITRERLYLEMMEGVLSNTSKVMINTQQSNPLLFLPLEQMMKGKYSAATSRDGSEIGQLVQPSAPQAGSVETRPSRETSRSGRRSR